MAGPLRKSVLACAGLLIISILFFSTSSTRYSFIPNFPLSHNGIHTGSAQSIELYIPSSETHNVIRSATHANGQYWPIDFLGTETMNPNIIPHPTLVDTWIIVAVKIIPQSHNANFWCAQVTCEATFTADTLKCTEKPEILPIATINSGKCVGDPGLELLNANIGPHDARAFYGPSGDPYIVFGSNGQETCFGQWMQDLRALMPWPLLWMTSNNSRSWNAHELRRPSPGQMEKNWFMFWDDRGDAYLHYDMLPSRSFSRIQEGGNVSEDLGRLVIAKDEQCMKAFMPTTLEDEDIHQASNSLAIVMCKRADPNCKQTKENTFIMHVFNHKLWHGFHGVYEPYVMLTRSYAPFELYGLSKKSFWIRGRGGPGTAKLPIFATNTDGSRNFEPGSLAANQTEMAYVTSINWRERGLNYQGYLDDVVMVGFGIEDEKSAVMDVLAADLIAEMGFCEGIV